MAQKEKATQLQQFEALARNYNLPPKGNHLWDAMASLPPENAQLFLKQYLKILLDYAGTKKQKTVLRIVFGNVQFRPDWKEAMLSQYPWLGSEEPQTRKPSSKKAPKNR